MTCEVNLTEITCFLAHIKILRMAKAVTLHNDKVITGKWLFRHISKLWFSFGCNPIINNLVLCSAQENEEQNNMQNYAVKTNISLHIGLWLCICGNSSRLPNQNQNIIIQLEKAIQKIQRTTISHTSEHVTWWEIFTRWVNKKKCMS